jgi:hypothetical protein
MALKMRLFGIFMGLTLLLSSFTVMLPEKARADDSGKWLNPYIIGTFVDKDGNEIIGVSTPMKPPQVKMMASELPEPETTGAAGTLTSVPAFTWVYGCAATSAGMLAGYYDQPARGYTNMYAGPTNGGVCPLNNEIYWGHTDYPGVTCGESPLVATHQGYDGLAVKGHVDDFWVDYGDSIDPYWGAWTQHAYADCTADYMGTNQYNNWNNTDGNTNFYFWNNNSPTYDFTLLETNSTPERDGCHGLKLFLQSRGYTVTSNYNQFIYGYGGKAAGFTYGDFKAQINAGRPVLIHVEGHTMLGYGYSDPSTIAIHDTWDNLNHTMTWGGTYSRMQHYGVTVIELSTSLGPPPADPSDLTATTVSSVQINLAWTDNSDNETGFKIERRTGVGGTYAQIGTVGANVTAYSNTGLTANTTYYYQVRSYSAAGDSDYCAEANAATFPLPPSAPVLTSPASGATGMNQTPRLAWNPSTGVTNSYSVQVSTASNFATTVINQSGVIDSFFDVSVSLDWNTRYYWRVNAVSDYGTSAWATARYFTTGLGPPPADPSDLTATTVSSAQINLAWTDNSDNETGFKIERRTGVGGTYAQIGTVGANVTAYSNTGLTSNTTYYYQVRSYSAAGDSDYCAEASAATLLLPPSVPVLKSPASGATGMNLTPRLVWNPSTGVTNNYSVQVSTVSNFSTTLVNETGVTDTWFDVNVTLEWNKTYYWRVNAVGPSGSMSAWTAFRSFKTATVPPPADPSDLTATTVSSVQINLAWTDNSDNETGFKIERRTGTGVFSQIGTVGANVTAYSNTGLTANTTYYYRIRSYNAAWNSNYSAEANATTLPKPPSVPVLKSPASGAAGMNLTPRLAWNPSTGVTNNYSVQVSTVSNFSTTLVNESGVTDTWFDMNVTLEWNKTYYWRVNAVGPSGSMSAWTASRSFRTATVPPPADPSDLTATTVSSAQINLAWTDNSNNETGFKIERRTGTGAFSQIGIVVTNVTAYSNTGLTANTTYYYRIRSYNAAWNSNYSAEANATTLPKPPSAPVLVSPSSRATGMNQTPRLAWNPSTGVTNNYSVQVSNVSTFATTLVNESGVMNTYFDVPGGNLDWNTRYYWRVNAVGPSGSTSAWTSYRYFKTNASAP